MEVSHDVVALGKLEEHFRVLRQHLVQLLEGYQGTLQEWVGMHKGISPLNSSGYLRMTRSCCKALNGYIILASGHPKLKHKPGSPEEFARWIVAQQIQPILPVPLLVMDGRSNGRCPLPWAHIA
eukprot:1158848-Pelagomonas_calceolata.AAC.11